MPHDDDEEQFDVFDEDERYTDSEVQRSGEGYRSSKAVNYQKRTSSVAGARPEQSIVVEELGDIDEALENAEDKVEKLDVLMKYLNKGKITKQQFIDKLTEKDAQEEEEFVPTIEDNERFSQF